jgi:hypothetical protein
MTWSLWPAFSVLEIRYYQSVRNVPGYSVRSKHLDAANLGLDWPWSKPMETIFV